MRLKPYIYKNNSIAGSMRSNWYDNSNGYMVISCEKWDPFYDVKYYSKFLDYCNIVDRERMNFIYKIKN